jgi:1-deoxyxylulose-5-phosphate synthase
MKQVELGETRLKVSRLCLGCMSFGGPGAAGFEWTLGYEGSRKIIDKAVDIGINFFDTADVYSNGKSEEIVGKALKGMRDDVVIATKVGLPTGKRPGDQGLGRPHVLRSLKRSLANLRTDRVDLYQIHRFDYGTPMTDILKTLTDVVRVERAADHIGASSMWAWQFAKLLSISDSTGMERFKTMQNHYNLVYREEEREMIPLCLSEGVPVNPWSPLARGFLTGRYRRDAKPSALRYKKDRYMRSRYFKPEDFDVVERLVEVAGENGVRPSQMALAWLLSRKGVASPVVGVTSVGQLEELAEAMDVRVSADDARRLEEPYKAHHVLGHQ